MWPLPKLMPRSRRKIVRRTMGKEPRVMTRSIIASSTDGGINILDVVDPTVDTGAASTGHVFEGADFNNQCSANSIVKYFNLRIQAAIKSSEAEFRPGWIEYGLVQFENETASPTLPASVTANVGTKTLAELLRTHYRNHCIWTGAIPISVETPVVADLHIKIPPMFCKNKMGTYWRLYVMFRSSKSTDSVTEIRSILSHEYKLYI